MTSIVVPAHNEAAVIGRCLEALTRTAAPGEFDIVVVCNGCTDATAEVAARFRPHVRVVETPVGSKPAALNLGDGAARSFPRLYVDGDVELTTDDARAIVALLESGAALAAAPRLVLDTRGCSLASRAYHRIWQQLPVIRDGLVGRGVYAVSRAGRERFGEFPPVVADDLYVHTRFTASERRTVADATSVVRAARTARELVRRKSRVLAGNRELRQRGLAVPDTKASWLAAVRERPALVTSAPAYLVISLAIRALAYLLIVRGHRGWQRDESSRAGDQEDGAGGDANEVRDGAGKPSHRGYPRSVGGDRAHGSGGAWSARPGPGPADNQMKWG